jgi:Domain of unknown function (DUF4375)
MRSLATLIFIASLVLVACSDASKSQTKDMDKTISKTLDEFTNRTRYQNLDVSTLESIADEKVEQAIIDFVGSKIDDNYAREKEIVEQLSPGVRALYVSWWAEAEINNGGFNQYFWNSAGQFANLAPASFEFFDARAHAALMYEALLIRQAEAETMKTFKSKDSLEAFSESYKHTKLNPLDQRYYKLSENISALRVAKIRQHPELFVEK